jgi:hypothetical protein
LRPSSHMVRLSCRRRCPLGTPASVTAVGSATTRAVCLWHCWQQEQNAGPRSHLIDPSWAGSMGSFEQPSEIFLQRTHPEQILNHSASRSSLWRCADSNRDSMLGARRTPARAQLIWPAPCVLPPARTYSQSRFKSFSPKYSTRFTCSTIRSRSIALVRGIPRF